MKKLCILTTVIATMAILFSSCQPYEEGPAFSLLSKKSRLAGKWEMSEWTANGTAVDISVLKPIYEFYKDGTGVTSVMFLGARFEQNIEWEFQNNGEQIRVRTKNQNTWGNWVTYTIVKLYNKEMAVERTYEENSVSILERISFTKKQ